jgi:vibriolysin
MNRIRNVVGFVSIAAFAACADAPTDPDIRVNVGKPGTEADPAAQVVDAEVVQRTEDGVTQSIRGDLGRVSGDVSDAQLSSVLASIGPMFRLSPSQLRLERVSTDELGNRFFRFSQVQGDSDVVGGALMVAVDNRGVVFSVNGNARGDFSTQDVGKARADLGRAVALVQAAPEYQTASVRANRTAYVYDQAGQVHLAYESVAEGLRGEDPFVDYVYNDVTTGAQVAVHPQIHFGRNRNTYNLNHGTSLPGTLVRQETSGTSSDAVLNQAHDNAGKTYDAYQALFGRDSYDNAGAQIKSSVHYSTNYVNAYWNDVQMVYGDGDNVNSTALTVLDVVAHELSHAVTSSESDLIYSGESGGLNEAFSDIMASVVEWQNDGQVISADTWMVGEDCWLADEALRFMDDPAKDGASKDLWVSGVGSADVHYTSGIANLAFKLLVTGGTHPRGKTTVVVPGIGMSKAAKIFYEANANCAGPSTNFLAFRNCTIEKAQLFYDADAVTATTAAWAAVGVGSTGPGPGPGPDPGTVVLTNGTPVTGIAGAKGSTLNYKIAVPAGASNLVITISGGTGDADLYTKFNVAPTKSVYDCRPYAGGNAETCTVAAPSTGDYFIMLDGYAAYSGVTLKASFTTGGGGPGPGEIGNNIPVTGLSDSGSPTFKFWKTASITGGRTLTVTISGGTGDADLYVRAGAQPTTSLYTCRPYKTGNAETCTITVPSGGAVYHIGLRDYSPYSGVTLKATW